MQLFFSLKALVSGHRQTTELWTKKREHDVPFPPSNVQNKKQPKFKLKTNGETPQFESKRTDFSELRHSLDTDKQPEITAKQTNGLIV